MEGVWGMGSGGCVGGVFAGGASWPAQPEAAGDFGCFGAAEFDDLGDGPKKAGPPRGGHVAVPAWEFWKNGGSVAAVKFAEGCGGGGGFVLAKGDELSGVGVALAAGVAGGIVGGGGVRVGRF